MPIDTTRDFTPLRVALLSVSDTRTLSNDGSGDLLERCILEAGHHLVQRSLLIDDKHQLVAHFCALRDDQGVDVVISTGGTGITARDVTPEAAMEVIVKELRGFGEIFRAQSFIKIGTSSIQGRALAGTAGQTIFFILPGSPGACRDAWGLIVEMLDSRFRPCNLAEMLPRMG